MFIYFLICSLVWDNFVLSLLLYFSFILFSSSSAVYTSEQVNSLRLACTIDGFDQNAQEIIIDAKIPDRFYLEAVTFYGSGVCTISELKALTGLYAETACSVKDILSALFYLRETGKFKKIIGKIYQSTSCGNSLSYSVKFYLEPQKILYKVTVFGVLRDKERYKNGYLIDVGDCFDLQKHKHSLEVIKQSLHENGYLAASISDVVTCDELNAMVFVEINIKRGPRFTFGETCVEIGLLGSQVKDLHSAINELCRAKLYKRSYCKKRINAVLSAMKILLDNNGCFQHEINIKQEIFYDLKSADLVFNIRVDRKKDFNFFGNKLFTRQDILDHLLLYGKSAWHFPSAVIIDEITQLYKSKGFWDVSVALQEENGQILCFIKEGKRSTLSAISFKGNDQVAASVLIKNNFLPLLRGKFIDRQILKNTLDAMIKYYKQQGFWDAEVLKYDFVRSKNGSTYKLIVTVKEGLKRIVGDIRVPMHSEVQEQMRLYFAPFVHHYFDQSLLSQQRQWLIRFMRSRGHFNVTVDFVLKENSSVVDIVWNVSVQESDVKFGKAVILGNSTIPHSLISKEIACVENETWDFNKIEQSLKNLREINVFDSVQIYPGKELDSYMLKPIFIKLIAASRYEIRTRFGLQQVGKNLQLRHGFTYKLGGTFCVKNIFNKADNLLMDADVTRFYRNVAMSYQFPWLFGRKIGCQLKVYDNLYQQPVYIGSQDSLYAATQQGLLWNMTRKFSRLTTSGTFGVEAMEIKEADQPRLDTIIDYDKQLLGKKTVYIFLEPSLVFQDVDAILNPTSGRISFLSCKGMFDLDSKTSFFKVLAEHSEFMQMSQRIVLALRLRGGHVFNRCFNQLIPIERFYLGGESSVRGYERDYCPPFGCLTKPIYDEHAGLVLQANNWWRYAPQGGRTMFNVNTEVRFPIYKKLGGVLFNDIGALFKYSLFNDLKSGMDNFFAGSGFGLRYETPIGPLRFDIAIKWRQPQINFQSRCVWYLTFGQAF